MASSTKTEDDSQPIHITGTPPQHTPRYTTIASFAPGSFLENLAVRRDGSILVSDMLSGSIWYINPHAEDGNTQRTVELVHRFEVQDTRAGELSAADVAEAGKGGGDGEGEGESHGLYASTPAAEAIVESPTEPDLFYLFSGIHGKMGTWYVYELDMRSFVPAATRIEAPTTTDEVPQQGKVRRLAPVPTATWLNGGTALPHPSEPLILMAESFQGRIYSYSIKTGRVDVWLEHALLGKVTTRPPWPGVNGVKYAHDGGDGWIYFTNSDRAILGRVKVSHDGDSPVAARNPGNDKFHHVDILASGCSGDDLCLDGDGSIYVATNPVNTVLKFPPLSTGIGERGDAPPVERQVILGLSGPRLTSAGEISNPTPDSGLDIDPDTTGPTAVAFGTTASDKKDLYVVTNGGIINPLGGVVREARVLRLHL